MDTYSVLIRELVVQNQNPLIASNILNPDTALLDFDRFPLINGQRVRKNINTSSKVNINYITEYYNSNTRKLNDIFFGLLQRTDYMEDNIAFPTKDDMIFHNIFHMFKPINSSFYDNENCGIKKALYDYAGKPPKKTCENLSLLDKAIAPIKDNGFTRLAYDRNIMGDIDGLGPNSLIFQDPEGEVIYSNRNIFEYSDWIDGQDLRKPNDILNRVLERIKTNNVYTYSQKKNDRIFEELNAFIVINTREWTQKLSEQLQELDSKSQSQGSLFY